MKKLILLIVIVMGLSGCATVTTSDGKWIRYVGILPGSGEVDGNKIEVKIIDLPPIRFEP